jgi:hypothetical protein
MQGIYITCFETNHVSRVYGVAAVLYLQFVMLFRPWNMFCTCTLALSIVYVQRPIRLFFCISWIPFLLSWYVVHVLSEWFWNGALRNSRCHKPSVRQPNTRKCLYNCLLAQDSEVFNIFSGVVVQLTATDTKEEKDYARIFGTSAVRFIRGCPILNFLSFRVLGWGNKKRLCKWITVRSLSKRILALTYWMW